MTTYKIRLIYAYALFPQMWKGAQKYPKICPRGLWMPTKGFSTAPPEAAAKLMTILAVSHLKRKQVVK